MPSDHEPPRDPRDVLRAHRSGEASVPGADDADIAVRKLATERVERVLEHHGTWLRRRVRATARHFRLDPDDLCQELVLSMLRRSATLDEKNERLTSWLGTRVMWTAKDMLRVRRDVPAGPEEFAAIEREQAARTASPSPVALAIDVRLLESLGLTPHEAQAVAAKCSNIEMTLKDFAALVHRSYASVRKDLERGTRRLEKVLGLTPEENDIIRAWRRHGSAGAAAQSLNRTNEDVLRILEDAHKKIDRIFDEREGLY